PGGPPAGTPVAIVPAKRDRSGRGPGSWEVAATRPGELSWERAGPPRWGLGRRVAVGAAVAVGVGPCTSTRPGGGPDRQRAPPRWSLGRRVAAGAAVAVGVRP